MDLSEKLLASKNLTEAYDAIMNAVGMVAWKHLEIMMITQELREQRACAQDMVPWSLFDMELLRRMQKFTHALPSYGDPVKPDVRLAGIVEQMENLQALIRREST